MSGAVQYPNRIGDEGWWGGHGSGAVDGVSMAKLRELAGQATPGPWVNESRGCIQNEVSSCVIIDDDRNLEDDDGQFIAAANPATVLWLLDRIEEARKLLTTVHSSKADFADAARAWLASFEENP